jgi:hypothetical protein
MKPLSFLTKKHKVLSALYVKAVSERATRNRYQGEKA